MDQAAPWLVPYRFKPGQSGNLSGMSKERAELERALNEKHIPKVDAMMDRLYARFMENNDAGAAALYLRVLGLGVKARDDGAVLEAARMLMQAAVEAKRARDAG